jgi:hypothetical protein
VSHDDNQLLGSVVQPVSFPFVLAQLVRLVVARIFQFIDPTDNERATPVMVSTASIGTTGDSCAFGVISVMTSKVGNPHVEVFHSGGNCVPDYLSNHLIRNRGEVFHSHLFSFLIFSFTHSIVQNNYF